MQTAVENPNTLSANGPPLALLLRRLSECPPDFLAAPVHNNSGEIHVAAIVNDVLRDLGGAPLPEELGAWSGEGETNAEQLRLVCVACWLLHDDWFRAHGDENLARAAQNWLASGLSDLSLLVETRQWLSDTDRREELARRALDALKILPQGETLHQAADRLKTLDSVERQSMILETRRAQERARHIRQEMARKKAEADAAARYGRE